MKTFVICLFLAIACFALVGVINDIEKRMKRKSLQRASSPPESPKPNVQQMRLKATFKIEYPNRLRIYEDSQRIASTTNNIDVLIRRCDEIGDYYDWLQPFIDAGLPVSVNMTQQEAHAELRKFFNAHAVRIAKSIIGNADTPRKRKNTIPKLELIKLQLRDAANKSECITEIDAIIRSIES
ncbi:MAG: hypothetical protein NC401_10355 [Ruminococcus sp.]|nr:hypothetical protein [Ruminococcus sp.]MCM1438972.1 hypothetical protein [Roseburia sp.]